MYKTLIKIVRLRKISLAFFISVFLVNACAQDELQNVRRSCGARTVMLDGVCMPKPGQIEGRVCNSELGAWMNNIQVKAKLNDFNDLTQSDENGFFAFENLQPGDYILEYNGDDYLAIEVATVLPGQTTLLGPQECSNQFGHIQGRACHQETGLWLNDAQVQLNDAQNASTQTDEHGQFQLNDILPGSYTVQIQKEESSLEWPIQVLAGETVFVGDLDCLPAAGALQGRVCGAEGYWLANATVSLNMDDGSTVTTSTDSDGYFTLTDVPAGTYEVAVKKGSFSTTFEVSVDGNGNTILNDPLCIPPDTRMAVITGDWDKVQDILTNLGFSIRNIYQNSATPTIQNPQGNIDIIESGFGMMDNYGYPEETAYDDADYDYSDPYADDYGYGAEEEPGASPTSTEPYGDEDEDYGEYDAYGDSVEDAFWLDTFLNDALWLAEYDIIFFNCGAQYILISAQTTSSNGAITNVQNFVNSGGSVYASDWAGEMIYAAFPERINFYGDDFMFDEAKAGSALGNQSAAIVDPTMSTSLGRTDVKINFDLDAWVALDAINLQPSDLNIYVKSPVELGYEYGGTSEIPLVVSFQYGQGKVLFTSAHNEAQTSADLRDILNYLVFEL